MDLSEHNHVRSEFNSDGAQGPEIWALVQSHLRGRIDRDEYTKWIHGLKFVADVDGQMVVAARDRVEFDRVVSNYQRRIVQAWRRHDPKGRTLRLECWTSAPTDLKARVGDPWSAPEALPRADEVHAEDKSSSMRFGTLVEGESNRTAARLIRRIADGETVPASVIVVHGPQGVGKTHLLRALQGAAPSGGRRVVYMSAEEFMSAYVEGAKQGDTSGLKRAVRDCDILAIDDVQLIAGKTGTDRELLAAIRAVVGENGLVILTADEAPGDLVGFSERMRSELRGAASVEITMPDEEMRAKIVDLHADLVMEAEPRFVLSAALRERIVRRVRGPGRALCGVIWSLYTETGCGECAPNFDMLEAVIRRQEGEVRAPTIEVVKRAAMRVFSVSKTELESPSKKRNVVYPRQIAMYVCRTKTAKSLPQIGRAFGRKDHTTVLHAFRKISGQLAEDADLAADVDRVEAAILDIQAEGRA